MAKVTKAEMDILDVVVDDNNVDSKDSKKNKKDKKDKKDKKNKKGNPILGFLIFIFLIGGIVALAFFDVLGLRTKYINPIAMKIPILKNLVKEEDKDNKNAISKEELLAKVQVLEADNQRLLKEKEDITKLYEDRAKEIERLSSYEKSMEQFNKDKALFDEAVAKKDTKAFIQFYQKFYPENADKIFKEAINKDIQTKDLKNYINTFSAMEDTSASKIMEEMMSTEIDLVVMILKGLDSEKSAAILGAMDTKKATVVAKRLAPEKVKTQ